jgi:phage terminase large subunit
MLSAKQREALGLLHSPAHNVLIYGGCQSGKTYVILKDFVAAAYQCPAIRQFVGRLYRHTCEERVWSDTLQKILAELPESSYELEKSKLRFIVHHKKWSPSIIQFGGFDEPEKLLGAGYNRIYFNECSEIPYEAVVVARTRLSKKSELLKNKLVFDCNPPSKLHWAYKAFIQKIDPADKKLTPWPNPDDFLSIRVNPTDNLDNLPSDFLQSLELLPAHSRARFRDGEWTTLEGCVYKAFNEEHILHRNTEGEYDLPPMEKYSCGLDFGLNMAAVLVGWAGDNIYILDDFGAYNWTTSKFNEEIYRLWQDKYNEGLVVYCDPAGGERVQEVYNGWKANNSIPSGIDFINSKIESGQFFVCDRCAGVLSELYSYRYNEREQPIDEQNHFMDSMRYACYSEVALNKVKIE